MTSLPAASLAALLQSFFVDRLLTQRQASAHTIAAYRDAFRLLLHFAAERLGTAPTDLAVADLDAPFVGQFLDHLEKDRANSARTRNARSSAIHSFFRYVALREPACTLICQRVLAMPSKRHERPDVGMMPLMPISA
jgi:integrase/recombinase XerD